MKTEIKRVVYNDTKGSGKIFKFITITTDNDETVFEGKLYTDSGRYKEPIDEEKLLKEIESIPSLLKL